MTKQRIPTEEIKSVASALCNSAYLAGKFAAGEEFTPAAAMEEVQASWRDYEDQALAVMSSLRSPSMELIEAYRIPLKAIFGINEFIADSTIELLHQRLLAVSMGEEP